MLADRCKGCKKEHECANRFINARKNDKIYCIDGSVLYINMEY